MKKIITSSFFLSIFAISIFSQTPTRTPLDPLAAEKQRADRLQDRYSNYANCGRYCEANINLAPPSKGEGRVVFMCDSITDGWQLGGFFPVGAYVYRGISG